MTVRYNPKIGACGGLSERKPCLEQQARIVMCTSLFRYGTRDSTAGLAEGRNVILPRTSLFVAFKTTKGNEHHGVAAAFQIAGRYNIDVECIKR